MSNLIKHAKKEFDILGWLKSDDEMQKEICDCILQLLKVFSEQGHSGSSAPYALNLFKKLASFDIISPLTGEDDEWNLISDTEKLFQNNRCSSVFKKNNKCYNIDGKVFIDPDGCSYTTQKSHVTIKKFPYTPSTKYIHVDKKGKPIKNG